MAFSFSNAVSSGLGSSATGANVTDGPELQEIQTNELGFAAVNGESKVQLLPTPWAADALPPATASVLSVASARGLLAAAGSDAIHIASTKKVRDTFRSPPPEKGHTRSFDSDIKLPYPGCHRVTFSSDESVLVVSPAEGGIVAFQVDSLQKGQLEPALRIDTNGQPLRALLANPVSESAELFAVITNNGELLMLDLKAGGIKSGIEGNVLRNGVSCMAWSNRGKQLIAGMADGTAVQLKPDGTVVATIPKSTSIPPESHVSGISWLENDTFFIIYTSSDTSSGIQPSDYYIVQREPKSTNYTFHKLPEILPPFGVERVPSYHFISRLRNFPPHLTDLLLLTATTATDVAFVSKSEKALSNDETVTNAFTFTMVEDDSRRAQLPLSSESSDTSPVGMVVDLSSSEKVPNPIPSDVEIDETEGPAPCLMVLNNEGILVAWWIIYNDSIRQKTTFPGLVSVSSAEPTATAISPAAAESPAPPPAGPSSTFAAATSSNAFTKPSNFGGFAAPSSFGTGVSKPFGTSSPIVSDKPSWASTGFGSTNAPAPSSGFGQPAFGSLTPIGGVQKPAFGSASAIGNRTPGFGQPSTIGGGIGRPSALGGTPSFGSASAFGAASGGSPFSSTKPDTSTSGFGSMAKGGGFASFAGEAARRENQSPFATARGANTSMSAFSTKNQTDSFNTFGSNTTQDSPFASKKSTDTASPFGGGNAFKLQPSFKGDGSAKDDLPPPKESSGFSFGNSFGDMLGETKAAASPARDREAEMDEESTPSEPDSDTTQDRPFQGFSPHTSTKVPKTLVTPPSTLNQSKATPAPPVSNLFGPPQQDNTTTTPQNNASGWSFNGNPSTTPKETPNPAHLSLFGTKTSGQESPAVVQKSEPVPTFQPILPTPEIKKEPPNDDEGVDLKDIPEASLPPDTVSESRYAPGETSGSSDASKAPSDDAPLPPDFLPVPKAGQENRPEQGLPEDDDDEFSSGFEDDDSDAGEEGEVEDDNGQEQDVQQPENEQIQTSPESSFKSDDRSPENSPTGGLFTKVSSTATTSKTTRPLFGEVGTVPVFAPSKPQESPRSPSPIRPTMSVDGLRADTSRSVSAPAHPHSIIDQRRSQYQQSGLAAQAARMREEEAAKEKARRDTAAQEQTQAEASQLESLEDDEDEKLREELGRPITPSETLDDFIPLQPRPQDETSKTGIPAQIERLYSDINSMICTLGLNCRSLSAYLQYQQPQGTNKAWPGVLKSVTPLDALNDELYFGDIGRLHEGHAVLSSMLAECDVDQYLRESGDAQMALKKEVFELRNKLMSIRKTLHSLANSNATTSAPLSAEQLSVQHDLRKAFTSVQNKIVQAEDAITVLRSKVAQSSSAKGHAGGLARSTSQRKPTVEAVTKTVVKMMSMAEQKSADVDVLEAQLKKLNISTVTSTIGSGDDKAPATPVRNRRTENGASPASTGSVYHTPDSTFGSGVRSNRGFRTSQNGMIPTISAEDKQRWQAKAQRRKQVASMLKEVLEEKRQRQIKGL